MAGENNKEDKMLDDTNNIKLKVDFIFKTLEETGLSMVDLSELTKISRPSLYRWRNGENITDMFRLNFVYNMSLRLKKATQIGKLPLKDKLKRPQKIEVLKKIVHETSPN